MNWIDRYLTKRGRRTGMIAAHLPGANCGACGFDSCLDYARRLHDEGGDGELCSVCDRAMLEALLQVLEREK